MKEKPKYIKKIDELEQNMINQSLKKGYEVEIEGVAVLKLSKITNNRLSPVRLTARKIK